MIERIEGGIRVSGPLVIGNATEVLEAVREAWPPAGSTRELTIDLGGTGPLDSAAVSLMLSWHRKARAQGVLLRYTGVPRALRTLADLYGVDQVLDAIAAASP